MKNKIANLILAGVLTVGCCIGATVGAIGDKINYNPTTVLAEDSAPLFISNGKIDYKIVYSSTISNEESLAVTELIDLVFTGTDIIMEKVTDKEVTWSESAKYICVGANDYSNAAGVTVDVQKLGTNGYHLESKGDSVFILGGGAWGTIYGVYEFLAEQLGYHYYYEDEIYFDADKLQESRIVNVNKEDKPNYEWRVIGDGEGNDNRTLRTRLRMHENWDAWATNGNVSWCHTFFRPENRNFGFVPLNKGLPNHRNWYNLDYEGAGGSPTAVCFSRDPEGLAQQVLEVCKEVLKASPTMNSINFSQPDNPTWCYCPKCCEIMDKYGGDCNSATQILFLKNYLSPILKEWTDANCPERNVVIYMYAYWSTKIPPKVTNSNIEELKLPDNCGVQYCPNFPSITPFPQEGEASYMETWKKISSNFAVYDYAENFGSYITNFDDFNRLQPTLQYFYEAGTNSYYSQQCLENLTNSDWSRYHMYILSNLLWDVHADVNALTKDWFEHYYRDAAPYMLEWFYSYRAWSEISGRAAGAVRFPLSECRNYDRLAQKAYDAIFKYKYTDPELYQKLYDRINLETISYRFSMLDQYQYAIENLKAYAIQFRNDCGKFGIGMINIYSGLDTWYANAGLADL